MRHILEGHGLGSCVYLLSANVLLTSLNYDADGASVTGSLVKLRLPVKLVLTPLVKSLKPAFGN